RMADSAGGLRAAAAETKRDTVTRGHLVDLRSALQLYVATDDTDVARRTRQAVEASIARLDLALDQQRRDADHADDVRITALERRGLDRLVAAWRSGAVNAGRVDSSSRSPTSSPGTTSRWSTARATRPRPATAPPARGWPSPSPSPSSSAPASSYGSSAPSCHAPAATRPSRPRCPPAGSAAGSPRGGRTSSPSSAAASTTSSSATRARVPGQP